MSCTNAVANRQAMPTLAEMAQTLELHRAQFGAPVGPQEVTRAEWDHLKSLAAPYLTHRVDQPFATDTFLGVRIVLKD